MKTHKVQKSECYLKPYPPLPLHLHPPFSQIWPHNYPPDQCSALPASVRLSWESVSFQVQTVRGPGSPCTRLGKSTGQAASRQAPDSIHK